MTNTALHKTLIYCHTIFVKPKSTYVRRNKFYNVVCFLLGNSLASEFYMPTFRNTLSVPSS
jgi:hypothetical protein